MTHVSREQHQRDPHAFRLLMCGGPSLTISVCHFLFDLDYPSDVTYIFGQTGDEQLRSVFGRHAPLCSHDSAAH